MERRAHLSSGVALKTESAERAVDVAIDLAERYGADLHLVTVFRPSGGTADGRNPRDDAEGDARRSHPGRTTVTTHIHVLAGGPGRSARQGGRRGEGRPHAWSATREVRSSSPDPRQRARQGRSRTPSCYRR